jgi:hypothetical protein
MNPIIHSFRLPKEALFFEPFLDDESEPDVVFPATAKLPLQN